MVWPTIPNDVVDWIREIMRASNDEVTERIVNQPNIRETSLDDALINKVARFAAPKKLPSGAVVMMEIHNIGSLRQFRSWELADIALVVHVFAGGKPLDQKIGLLQSKRLYPENFDVDADDPTAFRYGLNGLLPPSSGNALAKLRRNFEFLGHSVYGAISNPNDQLDRIEEFHSTFGEAVFYLLYNPCDVPCSITLPALEYQNVISPKEGARVVRTNVIASALQSRSGHPSFEDVKTLAAQEYWTLEHWVADLLLQCKVGRTYTNADHELIERLFYRRSGPIGAAIRINIDLSPDTQG